MHFLHRLFICLEILSTVANVKMRSQVERGINFEMLCTFTKNGDCLSLLSILLFLWVFCIVHLPFEWCATNRNRKIYIFVPPHYEHYYCIAILIMIIWNLACMYKSWILLWWHFFLSTGKSWRKEIDVNFLIFATSMNNN